MRSSRKRRPASRVPPWPRNFFRATVLCRMSGARRPEARPRSRYFLLRDEESQMVSIISKQWVAAPLAALLLLGASNGVQAKGLHQRRCGRRRGGACCASSCGAGRGCRLRRRAPSRQKEGARRERAAKGAAAATGAATPAARQLRLARSPIDMGVQALHVPLRLPDGCEAELTIQAVGVGGHETPAA